MADRNPLRIIARLLASRVAGGAGADVPVAASGLPPVDERIAAFDADFYLRRYPDVAAAGMSAWEHYERNGAGELRQPHPLFDPVYYLEQYKDVANAGVDPFVHYLANGWQERRRPAQVVDPDWYWMLHQGARPDAANLLLDYNGRADRESLELVPAEGTPRYILSRLADVLPDVVERVSRDQDATMRAAGFFEGRKCWSLAERVLRARMERSEQRELPVLDALARALDAQAKHWQVVEVLKLALEASPDDARRYVAMGEQYEKMYAYGDAVESYRNAIARGAGDPDVHYRLGCAAEKAGDAALAERSYAQAVATSQIAEVRRFGIGYLYEKRGLWKEAAEHYASKLQRSGASDAELHFRLGFALDRCYEWSRAREAYRKAISLDPRHGNWHYRAGLASERLGDFDAAATAYAAAAFYSGRITRVWSYRQAVCLIATGACRRACDAFMLGWGDYIRSQVEAVPVPGGVDAKALEAYACDIDDAGTWTMDALRANGIQMLKLGFPEKAARNFEAALRRAQDFDPGLHALRGYSLLLQERYEDACQAFLQTSVYRAPYGLSADGYEKNEGMRTVMRYNEYRETLPIQERTIVYQSFGGTALSCNPLALFMSARKRFEGQGWLHVWIVNDLELAPDEYRNLEDVVFVRTGSDLHLRYLASAKYLVNNATFPPWFIRREGQKYLNTWHGTPLKTLGRDMRGRLLEHKTFTRNLLHSTHVISPNPHTTEVLTRTNETQGLLTARVAETGYPRIDLTMNATDREVAALRTRLGIKPTDEVVLYAPTWRGEHGAVRLETDRLIEDLKSMEAPGRKVLFRGHALTEELLSGMDLGAYLVPKDVDTNQVLAAVDTLVTDYSSVFFDFLPLRRRIVLYVHDLEEYQRDRGLYFDIEEMPGIVCRTRDEMREALRAEVPRDKLERCLATFCPREDGRASERVLDFFIDDADAFCIPQEKSRPVLLYGGDFLANGITSSFLNLTSALCESGLPVVLVVEPDVIEADPVRADRFAELDKSIQVIGRYGRMVLSPEEKWLLDRFNTHYRLEPAQMRILADAYRREFLRTFGDAEFRSIVEFEGYIRFWMNVFAFGCPGVRRVAYLHNDMLKEFQVRFPYLRAIFALYGQFDALVSVSETMAKVNADSLAGRLGIDPSRFVHCDNIIDVDSITEKSREPLDQDLAEWTEGSFVLVNLGRLSPEKDQSKLIDAFAEVANRWPQARLVIAGDGPLKLALAQKIEDMGLEGRVLLAGLRRNPFPLLRRADCFVLSSNHEGQPMVLLEAMVLGKPIVATDIDGNRGLLGKLGYGYLVPNSREGLVGGLERVLAGEMSPGEFSVQDYRRAALEQFVQVAIEAPLTTGARPAAGSGMRLANEGSCRDKVSQ